MEEYMYSDVTAEDEAVLEAEESADQEEIAGLDDDLGAVSVNDVEAEENEPDDTAATAETPDAESDAVENDAAEQSLTENEAAADAAEQEPAEHEDATDTEETPDAPSGDGGNVNKKRPQLVTVVGVRFRTAGKAYYFSPGPYKVRHSMHVIVETARGVEYGTVVTMPMELERRKIKSPLKEILRPATPEDDATHQENRRKEREAYKVCFKKIREHNLDMKLIDAEYTFDHSKILFYFTADGRIDFRDLVKDLAGVFKTRIELRQIGVRDETKILGGYGSCGRPLCCHTYLSDFVPVSIKMAKEQNLSLNPTKISGVCGRLMCCLKNEQETYEELNKNLPRQGDEVEGPDGLQGEVESVNVLRQKVRILVEVDDEKEIHEYNADEITMIRRRKRGEAKHRSKRIENGQESADELRKTTRKGRPDRLVRQDDAERAQDGERQTRDGNERPARENRRDRGERPMRDNNRDNNERQNRGDSGERAAQGEGTRERGSRRPDGRRNGRGSREDRQNAAQERQNRDGQNGHGGRSGHGGHDENRADRGNNGGENGNSGNEERQNAGRGNRRRRGHGRGERRDGQPANGQGNAGSQTQTGGTNES